jgi:hypothetical protein
MIRRILVLALLIAVVPAPAAFADVTAFIGTTTTPANRTAKGFAIGVGLVIVGFEFEYSTTTEEPIEDAPSLRTGMGNVLLQTPVAIMGLQPYFTTGGGYTANASANSRRRAWPSTPEVASRSRCWGR